MKEVKKSNPKLLPLPLLNTARKFSLTFRELEIMYHITEGKTSKQIANELNISVKTVDNHRTNIRCKTDCHNAVGIARFAIRNGFVGNKP